MHGRKEGEERRGGGGGLIVRPQFLRVQDYGRLSHLEEQGIKIKTSDLEMLTLARVRCAAVTYKVIAWDGDEANNRLRLHGHTIVHPQDPVDVCTHLAITPAILAGRSDVAGCYRLSTTNSVRL